MKPPADRFTIFVVCDDSRSHAKAQAITNFVRVREEDEDMRLPGHHWDEVYPGRRKSGADSAVTLVDNADPGSERFAGLDDDYWSRARAVYELECRKCRKPHEWRLEKLFHALDLLQSRYEAAHDTTGVLPVSLAELSGIVRRMPGMADTSE